MIVDSSMSAGAFCPNAHFLNTVTVTVTFSIPNKFMNKLAKWRDFD